MKTFTRAALLVAGLTAPAAAQESVKSSFDRTAIPKPAADPVTKIPAWGKATLSNGAQLIVLERHSLPLVQFSMNFVGGSNQLESAEKTGVGDITASMMSEGTTLRSGDEISNALQLLGTSVSFGIGSEGGSVTFRSMKDKFEPVLAILAEQLLHPAFPQAALDRQKQRSIVRLREDADQTSGIANVVFPKLLYGPDHPYGRTQSEESINRVTRDDVVAFYKAFYQPARATIVVAGDITLPQAKARIEKAFAGWTAGGTPVAFNYPTPPASKPTTIYLVDKPGAAQSTVYFGLVGPSRSTPDYFPLRVFNNLFGEQFMGRLNGNIREAKGWSYGYRSAFSYGRGPGMFRTSGEIQTDKTDSAVVEIMKEIRGVRGEKPVTSDELDQGRAALVQALPDRIALLQTVIPMISEIYTLGLPEDYWTQFQTGVKAVTAADVERVAKQYVDPDRLTILVVGDRAKIEAKLRATNVAPVVVLDAKGNPIG